MRRNADQRCLQRESLFACNDEQNQFFGRRSALVRHPLLKPQSICENTSCTISPMINAIAEREAGTLTMKDYSTLLLSNAADQSYSAPPSGSLRPALFPACNIWFMTLILTTGTVEGEGS